MPWNILVLPLLGGFLFVEYFLPTRIAVRRHHPQRLILHSAHVGVWLLLCSTLLLHLSSHLFSDEYELARQTMQSITTIPHLGKSIGALLIGLLLPRISNWFYGKYCSLRDGRHSTSIRDTIAYARYQASRHVVIRRSDPLEMFLFKAVGKRFSMFTLASGKVYVGILLDEPNSSDPLNSIRILPWESGFRNDRHEYRATTEYRSLYGDVEHRLITLMMQEIASQERDIQQVSPGEWKKIEESYREQVQEQIRAEAELMPIVIQLREIVSVRRFDPEIYHDHFSAPIISRRKPPTWDSRRL